MPVRDAVIIRVIVSRKEEISRADCERRAVIFINVVHTSRDKGDAKDMRVRIRTGPVDPSVHQSSIEGIAVVDPELQREVCPVGCASETRSQDLDIGTRVGRRRWGWWRVGGRPGRGLDPGPAGPGRPEGEALPR